VLSERARVKPARVLARRDSSTRKNRFLLVCDNASVHKADELKKLMDQHGIILRFLPPNMMQWLQPLDRVVCGLKIVQRARRGRQLAANLQQWKQEQERIVGEALLNKRLTPS
jgi:hypothetical protein